MTLVRARVLTALAVVTAVLPSSLEATRADLAATKYTGVCDASAGAAISAALFVIASDEDNRLRVYRRRAPGTPVQELDVGAFLKLGPKQEADIEGAARLGDRIYWITSHGIKKAGEPRPSRHRLFATDVKLAEGQVTMTTVGTPYEDLLQGLVNLPGLRAHGLPEPTKASTGQEASNPLLGLNIEGLSGTPQQSLLIAFRSPVSAKDGGALVVPLDNPAQVVRGGKANFGAPISLPLDGLGVRSMEYVETIGQYLIIAGPTGEDGGFRLYRWAGPPSREVARIADVDLKGLQPEALIVYPAEEAAVQVLSDDGTVQVEGRDCKRARPDTRRFRSVWVSP